MSASLKYLFVISSSEALKAELRSAGGKSLSETEIFVEKSPNAAVSSCFVRIPDAVVIDWSAFPANEITLFLQRLRKLRMGSSIPVGLVCPKASPQVISVAAEYDVLSVVAPSNLQGLRKLLQSLADELATPPRLREKLSKLQAAAELNDDASFSALLEELFEKFPENPTLSYEYANLCLRRGKTAEARNLATKAALRNPRDLRASNILARAHLLEGQHDKALSILKTAEAMSPKNVQRLLMLGDAFLGAQKRQEARRSFSEALRIEPGSSHAMAGVIASESGDATASEVLAVLREAHSPEEQASLFNTAGILAARRQDLTTARLLYESALGFVHRDDTKARLHFNLGLAFERAGRLEEAKVAYGKALELDSAFGKSAKRLEALAASPAVDGVPRPEGELEAGLMGEKAPLGNTIEKALGEVAERRAVTDAPAPRAAGGPKEPNVALDAADDAETPERLPSFIEMLSDEKVMRAFPIEVLKRKKKS